MDEKLTVAQVAARLGIAPSTWRSYVNTKHAPAKDGEYDRRTPWWFASTIDAWAAARPGRGARTDLAS